MKEREACDRTKDILTIDDDERIMKGEGNRIGMNVIMTAGVPKRPLSKRKKMTNEGERE